jgi:hypothetical protein
MTNHPNRSKTCRPREHLRAIAKKYPQAWRQVDLFRAGRGKDLPDWPHWCFLPIAASHAIVTSAAPVPDFDSAGDIAAVAGLTAWRTTQTIYRFDPALAAPLLQTPVDLLPRDLLYRLPEWCVYIETPDCQWVGERLVGFFCHLEHDIQTGRPELRLLLDLAWAEPGVLASCPLHIDHGTIGGAVEGMLAESKKQVARARDLDVYGILGMEAQTFLDHFPAEIPGMIAAALPPLLSLVLYLCADDSDIGPGQLGRPRAKKTKKGWRLFPADNPSIIEVGYKVGRILRQYNLDSQTGQTGDRQGPRPHIRRAHWHSYRTGPGRQRLTAKWLAPIPVNFEGSDELPVTVRKVKK